MQIRLHEDPVDKQQRLIGMETSGYTHVGETWRFSTIDNWQLEGKSLPQETVKDKLKQFCRQVFELFQ